MRLLLYAIVLCLGCYTARAKSNYTNEDSVQAFRLLELSEKATDKKLALDYAVKSLSIAVRMQSNRIIALSYRQLSNLYRAERAPRLYTLDSLWVHYAAACANKPLYFDGLQAIIKDYLNNNEFVKAESYLPLLDSMALLSSVPKYPCVANQVKGFFYFKQFKMARALEYDRKALGFARQSQSSFLIARSLYQIGQDFVYLFKNDSATFYLYQSLDELKKDNDDFQQANVWGTLAFLHQVTGHLPAALNDYATSRQLFEKAGHPIDAAYSELSAAEVYFTQQKNDSAYYAILRALVVMEQYQVQQGRGLCYSSLGRYYNLLHNKDSADHYFALSKAALLPLKHTALSMYVKTYESIKDITLGDAKKGEAALKEEVAQMHNIYPAELIEGGLKKVIVPGLTDSLRMVLRKKLLTGDTSKLAMDSVIMINPVTGAPHELDSMEIIKQHKAVAQVEAKYKVKEAKASEAMAKKDAALTRQALLFVLLISLITGLFLWLQIKSRKTIEKLKVDADHRVANTLTNIASIVERVGTTSADKPAFGLLKEKLAPLSLVYNLLGKEQTEVVLLQQYFDSICNGLKISYDHDNRIQLHIDAQVSLPGKKASRAGLIVNELVTNSFKHAFTEQATGHIYVVCKKMGKQYYLSVGDSGTGIAQPKPSQKGLQLVKGFARELSATIHQKKEQGVQFEFYFI